MSIVARIVARALVGVLALAVGGLVVATLLLPRAVGGDSLTVLTGSMTPKMPVGTLVVTRPVDPNLLGVGDVVTYVKPDEVTGEQELVTHRIVKVRGTQPVSFVTKGDANDGRDLKPVFGPNVQGEVWYHLPYVGTFQQFFTSTPGGAMTLGIALLAGYALFQAGSALRERRPRTRRQEVPSARATGGGRLRPSRQ